MHLYHETVDRFFLKNEQKFAHCSWTHIDHNFSLRKQENVYDVWNSLLQLFSYSTCCCPLSAVSHFDIKRNPVNLVTNRPLNLDLIIGLAALKGFFK